MNPYDLTLSERYFIATLAMLIIVIIFIHNEYYQNWITLRLKNHKCDKTDKEEFVLIPNRYRNFKETSDYWIPLMDK